MYSPTGYYAVVTSARWIKADPDDLLDWSTTDTYPVVSFTSGRSVVVDRDGNTRIAVEYAQAIRENLGDAGDGARFTVDLTVTPRIEETTA